MKKLIQKELTLAASPLSYFFLIAAFLTLVPSYPILLSAFFTSLGIFYSFQTMRENGDLRYSFLLPVSKAEIVSAKYAFCVILELCSFFLTGILTLVRMLFLSTAAVYLQNSLMGANLTYLGYVLILFTLFNLIFVGGFFKTAYRIGKPFIFFCVLSLVLIGVAETLHHIPGPDRLYVLGFENLAGQIVFLFAGILLFTGGTALAVRISQKRFEKIDL